ncbi:MAG: hypothetical protein F6K42_25990 [Leptolyngbya sp. SIO1D8]|nr:hypothetical protein [Leptolyngbya sp. SIO1D8]
MRFYSRVNDRPLYRDLVELLGWIQAGVFLACAFGFTPPAMDYWFSPAFYGRQIHQAFEAINAEQPTDINPQ